MAGVDVELSHPVEPDGVGGRRRADRADGALGFVELEMKAAGLVNFGTELHNPDFSAVGAALGLHSERVSYPDDLEPAFQHDGPALV